MSVFTPVLCQADHPAQGTAATTESFIVGECNFEGNITEVAIFPEAALTAADTNTRTFTVFNRGQDGTGTTVVATLSTAVAGGNWVAGDKKTMTLAAAADLDVEQGDVLECVETVAGTGATHPQLQMQVRGTPASD